MFVATERIVRATAATLTFQGVDQDGEPAAPGTVTVGVTKADGTTLVNAGTSTTAATTTTRTTTLTAAQTASLDLLTATWTVSGTAIGTTKVEIVGGVYVSVADIRATDPTLTDTTDDPTATLKRARRQAEQLLEAETGVSWVPRFDTVRLDGTGGTALLLPWPMLRSVSWGRIYSDEDTYTTLTAAELAAIPADPSGIAWRTDGKTWDAGHRNIELGFTHGYDTPHPEIRDACIQLVREFSRAFDNAVSSRQTGLSFDGVFSPLVTAGVRGAPTNIPAVNAAIRRHSHRTPGIA